MLTDDLEQPPILLSPTHAELCVTSACVLLPWQARHSGYCSIAAVAVCPRPPEPGLCSVAEKDAGLWVSYKKWTAYNTLCCIKKKTWHNSTMKPFTAFDLKDSGLAKIQRGNLAATFKGGEINAVDRIKPSWRLDSNAVVFEDRTHAVFKHFLFWPWRAPVSSFSSL